MMNSNSIKPLEGGCSVAAGFQFSGIHCGIKKRRDDLALIVADESATVAGMFTSNQVKAPPVRYCQRLVAEGHSARAVVINSGNANACTGVEGMNDAVEMARLVAEGVGCEPEEVFVSSTGVIGPRLPMAALRSGIPLGISELASGASASDSAAHAILTTDTCMKTCAYQVELSNGTVHIGGMAKGSGMIAPDLVGPAGTPPLPHATTLAYLLTDAVIGNPELQGLLHSAMNQSFNCITVDSDTSTNDTVLLLASGASGVNLNDADDVALFAEALRRGSLDLALKVVKDGEGAQRLIEVRVSGARSEADARAVARTVAESPLVKTAFCAGEPNWGRFLMAVGRSGVALVEEHLTVSVNDLEVVRAGMAADHCPDHLRKEMIRDEVLLSIDLGEPQYATSTVWTCDLSEEYVRINGSYLT